HSEPAGNILQLLGVPPGLVQSVLPLVGLTVLAVQVGGTQVSAEAVGPNGWVVRQPELGLPDVLERAFDERDIAGVERVYRARAAPPGAGDLCVAHLDGLVEVGQSHSVLPDVRPPMPSKQVIFRRFGRHRTESDGVVPRSIEMAERVAGLQARQETI